MNDSERGEQPGDNRPEDLMARVAGASEEAVRARVNLVGKDDPLSVPETVPNLGICRPWYEAAATLYAAATAAYAQGNAELGLMYELSAASHLAIGQVCVRAAGG